MQAALGNQGITDPGGHKPPGLSFSVSKPRRRVPASRPLWGKGE